jgi:CpeT protein
MKKPLLCAATALALAACGTTPPPAPASGPSSAPAASNAGAAQVAELEKYLIGYFSSADQAKADKDFFNIELRVVRVWPDRKDGPWLYVEQADARTPEKPYRQRLYRLEYKGSDVISHIYTIKGDGLRYAGEWKKPVPMAGATLADIELKDGCAVIMQRNAKANYVGSTVRGACPSELRGAKYATSIVDVSPTLLESWDQGFSADHKQVWGSTKGAYKFVKISQQPS